MNKILTIIVPSYNMEAYLPKCLSSLIVDDAELLQALDVIVVNDGSKDRTSEIAHEFERKYPGVFRVIDKQNGHYGSCVNAGLAEASGKYVRILDADDSHDTAAFLKFLRKIIDEDRRGATYDFCFSKFIRVDPEGMVLSSIECPFIDGDKITPNRLMEIKAGILTPDFTFRTSLLREISYRQTEGILYTDTEWFFMPLAYAREGLYVDCCLYRYFVGRPDQSCNPEVERRTYAQLEMVIKSLMAFYNRNHGIAGVNDKYLLAMIRRVFSVAGMYFTRYLTAAELSAAVKSLSRDFAAVDGLGDVFDSYTVLRGRKFKYLTFAFNHPSMATPVISFARWYMRRRDDDEWLGSVRRIYRRIMHTGEFAVK